MSRARVLLVEDRASLRRMLTLALEGEGHPVLAVGTAEEAFAALDRGDLGLVLTDLKLPTASGLEVLEHARASSPPVPVVVMTAYGTVADAVDAMKRGAVDFLEKPVDLAALFRIVDGALADQRAPNVFAPPGARPIVGSHPRLLAALRLLERVAPTESTVLLTGESGTGKELFAHALHACSRRSDGPFVAVNCAAIPEALVENELFGHEKGAFTGAHARQAGRFEAARRGTLLLDEIGELPLATQGKVLRVLEERTFERVGGHRPESADVRLVAATNRDLGDMVAAGTFRSDLFFRLDVFPIHLPALRERAADIPQLARHLLAGLEAKHGLAACRLTPGALEALAGEPWPGNVRQLSNLLERALILMPGETVGAPEMRRLLAGSSEDDAREAVRRALDESAGDKGRAAALLGVSPRTLQRKIRDYDLEGYPRYRS